MRKTGKTEYTAFYSCAPWRKLRERVLRRDHYECRECRRYGIKREAEIVHHIWPHAEYPRWRLRSWNCISLCRACHEKMHDRETGGVSEKGREWQERTPPPRA